VVNRLNKHDEVLQLMIFSDVVEIIKNLSTDEKREIQLLLQQYLREERRDAIYNNFKSAQVEQQKGELKFSSNVKELRQLIEE
jgi:transcriptional regulator with AAA-type ATPase domain